jgi:hypothetical protein
VAKRLVFLEKQNTTFCKNRTAYLLKVKQLPLLWTLMDGFEGALFDGEGRTRRDSAYL